MLYHDLYQGIFGQYGETDASATCQASSAAGIWRRLVSPGTFLSAHTLTSLIWCYRVRNDEPKSKFHIQWSLPSLRQQDHRHFGPVLLLLASFVLNVQFSPLGGIISGQLSADTKSGRKSLKGSWTVEATSSLITETGFLISAFLLHNPWCSVVSQKSCQYNINK